MRNTFPWFVAAVALVVGLLPMPGLACSYPDPIPFNKEIESASSIFIFRLESAELRRKTLESGAYSELVEGRIRVTRTLKGDSSPYLSVAFSTSWCGGLRLDVGHYFLVVTDGLGPTLTFGPSDLSILDVTRWYDESLPEHAPQGDLLWPIFEYLRGKPLPESFPPERAASFTLPHPGPPPRAVEQR